MERQRRVIEAESLVLEFETAFFRRWLCETDKSKRRYELARKSIVQALVERKESTDADK